MYACRWLRIPSLSLTPDLLRRERQTEGIDIDRSTVSVFFFTILGFDKPFFLEGCWFFRVCASLCVSYRESPTMERDDHVMNTDTNASITNDLDDVVSSLKYGDCVTLSVIYDGEEDDDDGERTSSSRRRRLYLSADGFARKSMVLTERSAALKNFVRCVFKVCPKTQYPAMAELNLAKCDRKQDAASLERLQAAVEKERVHNRSEMERRFGSNVRYGDVIQLRHEYSGRFVSVNEGEVAEVEPTRLQTRLCPLIGSDECWLKIRPRYDGIRRGTDNVEINDHVIFEFSIRTCLSNARRRIPSASERTTHPSQRTHVSSQETTSSYMCPKT